MTDTTAEPEYGTDHQEDAQAPLGGTLEHLDPTSLVLGENVREYPNLNKPFLDSIAEHGVLVPLTAIRRHGAVEVRAGSLWEGRCPHDQSAGCSAGRRLSGSSAVVAGCRGTADQRCTVIYEELAEGQLRGLEIPRAGPRK